jgi:hypothetical protein
LTLSSVWEVFQLATATRRIFPVLHLGSSDASDVRSARDGAFDLGSVSSLQSELGRIGALQPDDKFTPGTFDHVTYLAVRRLQWFARNIPGCLSARGTFLSRKPVHLPVDGIVGPNVLLLLDFFRRHSLTVTGNLVQLRFNAFKRIAPNSHYKSLVGTDRNIGICDREFAHVLAAMNAAAVQFGVYVFVNQLFRVEGHSVSGAVVPPASFSAHKIGRAADLQLGLSGTLGPDNPQLSSALKSAAKGTPFYQFREHAKKHLHCRYGGDFHTSDSPHFDRQVLPGGSESWRFHFFFSQLHYHQAMKNHLAIPTVD